MSRRVTVTLLAAAFGALAVITWVLAFRTGAGHHADVALLRRVDTYQSTRLLHPAQWIAYTCDTFPYAVAAVLVVAVAVLARGPRTGLVAAGLIVIPNALTQVLKIVTAQNRVDAPPTPLVHVDAASWPSGHSTASLTLALAVVLIAPTTWRPVVAVLGVAYAAAVGTAVVLLGWHFPSDVAGGFAVAGAGACVAAACLPRDGRPQRLRFSRPDATAALPSRSPRAPG